jgi:hypothetical protein
MICCRKHPSDVRDRSNTAALPGPWSGEARRKLELFHNQIAVGGMCCDLAVVANLDLIDDTGKTQEVPGDRCRRQSGTGRGIGIAKKKARKSVFGLVHADDLHPNEPGAKRQAGRLMQGMGTGAGGIGRSSCLARAAGMVVISEPESTRNISRCQAPAAVFMRSSSSP